MLGKLATMCIVVLLLAGIVIAAWSTFGMTASPLTLSIGSGPIALVQSSSVTLTTGTKPSSSLALPSSPGTLLIAITGNSAGGGPPTILGNVPSGWAVAANTFEGAQTGIEIHFYANNPGGIQAVTFTGSGTASWHMQLSEWANTGAIQAEAVGQATTTSGSTLTQTASPGIAHVGDLAITAWLQHVASGTSVFTTPPGWTRLADDGAVTGTEHLDIEYILNPPWGPLTSTLSSTQTTLSAAGNTFALIRNTGLVDMTAFLKYD